MVLFGELFLKKLKFKEKFRQGPLKKQKENVSKSIKYYILVVG
jgi:hypothetical protein